MGLRPLQIRPPSSPLVDGAASSSLLDAADGRRPQKLAAKSQTPNTPTSILQEAASWASMRSFPQKRFCRSKSSPKQGLIHVPPPTPHNSHPRRGASHPVTHTSGGAGSDAMRKAQRRRGKSEISGMLQRKGNSQGGSHGACWSDSDGPQSKFIKYDAESVEDFNKDGLQFFESVFRIRRSVVSLTCTADGMDMVCSGTVVDHVDQKTWILTSASLVRKPDTLFEAYEPYDVKIQVALHNKQFVEGRLEMCNLHYNIAIVTIEFPVSQIDLPAVELSDLPECYSLQPRPVVALGRDMYTNVFQMRCGELVRVNSELDCTELLTCTCDVSEDFIGGPVMDSERRFLGITFRYQETTPFLPVEIAARCLKYYKKLKTLPRVRIRGRALHTLGMYDLEQLCCKYAKPPHGILVQEICEISAEKCGGVVVGDIISELDGITVYSAAQFTAMLLDKMEVASNQQNALTLQAVVRRPADQTIFVAKLNVQDIASDECEGSLQNK